jgi:hypothetical protein
MLRGVTISTQEDMISVEDTHICVNEYLPNVTPLLTRNTKKPTAIRDVKNAIVASANSRAFIPPPFITLNAEEASNETRMQTAMYFQYTTKS